MLNTKIKVKMKIAIPTKNNRVDAHFGHCQYYTVFTVEEKQVTAKEIIPSPQGCGCKSEIASTLKHIGVEVMLAGNMGNGAINKVTNAGIQVIKGCDGDVDMLVRSWLNGEVADSGTSCDHHEHGHQCSH